AGEVGDLARDLVQATFRVGADLVGDRNVPTLDVDLHHRLPSVGFCGARCAALAGMLRPSKADVHRTSSRRVGGASPRAHGPRRPGVRGAGRWENPAAMGPKLSWTLQPQVLVALAIAAGVYVRRWRGVRLGPSPRRAADAPVWRLCCFLGSLTLALAALVSPVDALADQ